MADEIDRANEAAAVNLDDALARRRVLAASAPKLTPMGECRNQRCGEPFAANDNRLFCNADCADEYARLSRASR